MEKSFDYKALVKFQLPFEITLTKEQAMKIDQIKLSQVPNLGIEEKQNGGSSVTVLKGTKTFNFPEIYENMPPEEIDSLVFDAWKVRTRPALKNDALTLAGCTKPNASDKLRTLQLSKIDTADVSEEVKETMRAIILGV